MLVEGDGHGNAISPALSNARCLYCRGEPECVIEGCSNIAQRGSLCRVCASKNAPGQLPAPSGGDWWAHRDVLVWLMRNPLLEGVAWKREGDRIVGRKDALVISLKTQLWAPLPTNPETA